MATHVKVVAALFLVVGVFLLSLAAFAPFVMNLLARIVGATDTEDAAAGAAVLGVIGMAAGAIMLLLAVPYIACGIGLLKRKRWARILGIVLGAVALIRFPIGTAFGVYALVILFRKDTEALFPGSDPGLTRTPV